METAVASQKIDHVLVGLLQTDQAELSAALDRILAVEAEPVITKILRYRIQSLVNPRAPKGDLEDVHSEVVLRLLTRLQDFLGNPEERGIGDFCKYVAVVTHNACNDYFRESSHCKHCESQPQHTLKNRRSPFLPDFQGNPAAA